MLAAVICMGVLIVAGVATLGRDDRAPAVAAPAPVAALLDEPAGTHMPAMTAAGDRLAVLLQGGGPDRIVLLDPRTGQVAGRVGLAHEEGDLPQKLCAACGAPSAGAANGPATGTSVRYCSDACRTGRRRARTSRRNEGCEAALFVLSHRPATSCSSRGLGHRPLTAVTGVRIPYGTPGKPPS